MASSRLRGAYEHGSLARARTRSVALLSPPPRDMPIDPSDLSSLAADYAKGMTRIRGRRVQRLVRREFAGATYVLVVEVAPGRSGILGLSESGAGYVATNGSGRQASVIKWLHGAYEGTQVQFDLYKDSLPVLQTRTIPLTGLPRRADLRTPVGHVPEGADRLLSLALQAP